MSIAAGHSTAKLTLDTDGHLMGTHADRAALERVNRAFEYGTGTDRARPDASGVGQTEKWPLTLGNVVVPRQDSNLPHPFRIAT